MVDKKKVKKGKKSRVQGMAFENRVRLDLESKGFVCDKWTNNVENGKIVKARAKWSGPNRPMMMGAGFPDFLVFRRVKDRVLYSIIGVECKMSGELDKQEKEKCVWLLDKRVFSMILIAKKLKIKNRICIEYEDFKEKYWRLYK